jgi:hypothetical protein
MLHDTEVDPLHVTSFQKLASNVVFLLHLIRRLNHLWRSPYRETFPSGQDPSIAVVYVLFRHPKRP